MLKIGERGFSHRVREADACRVSQL